MNYSNQFCLHVKLLMNFLDSPRKGRREEARRNFYILKSSIAITTTITPGTYCNHKKTASSPIPAQFLSSFQGIRSCQDTYDWVQSNKFFSCFWNRLQEQGHAQTYTLHIQHIQYFSKDLLWHLHYISSTWAWKLSVTYTAYTSYNVKVNVQ